MLLACAYTYLYEWYIYTCVIAVSALVASSQKYALSVCLCQGHALQGNISTSHMAANKATSNQC